MDKSIDEYNEYNTITSNEMAIVDMNCEYYGLSGLQLMENAGRGVAEEVAKLKPSEVLVFAGTGNNGGDSFVASRILLSKYRIKSKIYLLGRKREVKSDIARKNLNLAELSGIDVAEFNLKMIEFIKKEIEEKINKKSESYNLVILDAMLGTGVKGELREPYYSVVELINSFSKSLTVVAVDIPTGLNPDTGKYSKAVKANITVTFHKLKPGLVLSPETVGEVIVKDIGITPQIEKLTGPGDVKFTFRRNPSGHKGSHGRILIVGGGEYTGAPTLSAIAALKAGADLAFVAVPEKIKSIVSSYSPELIVRGVEFSSPDSLSELAKKCHVAVIGMGMDEKHSEKVLRVVGKHCKKIVLDAGGIFAVNSIDSISSINSDNKSLDVIITPHSKEFEKFFGLNANLDNAMDVAKEFGITVLLKGVEDKIICKDRWKVNKTGNAGMTVGGTGDILSGVVGAFFVNNDSFSSASAAAFVTGLAGDICLEEMGYCYTAMDVIRNIPKAITKSISFS